MQVEALLFQGSEEALHDPVTLGFPDIRRGQGNAQPLHLVDPAAAVYCGPQSQRSWSPRAQSLRKVPKAYRTPCQTGSRAA